MKNLLNAVVENNDLKPKQKAKALLELRNLLDEEELYFYYLTTFFVDQEEYKLKIKDKVDLNKENQNLVNRAIGKIKL